LKKVAFFYATFPRFTETFVRRELRAFEKIGFHPELYSIWRGQQEWEGKKINRFQLFHLFSLFFWIPYWAWTNPRAFKDILTELWDKPCPNLQNWNETFLALGYALVEAKKIKSEQYDLLHGVWATMPATAVFALSKLTNTPFSLGAHAYDVFRMGGDWLLRMKFQDALFIRTSSKSTAVRIEEIGVVPEKIKLIRRGIAEWPIRESYELVSKKCLELVSVGRLVEKKGYYHQLQIAAHLRNRDIPFRLRIVGTGPLEKSLLKERNRLGLDAFVEFTGSKTEQEVRAIYLQSDVFLFTGVIAKNGDRDGIPNVIPEAMSAGCLILASVYAGASEPFIEDVSGFSMNPLNPKDWIDILTEFWFNPEAFTIMRKYAVNHAKKSF
jgi:glycosyltransferase involved in cell wall biosynthesis